MSNKYHRLLNDVIVQNYKTKNKSVIKIISKLDFGIRIKFVPPFKKILFKNVLIPHSGGCKTKRILKIKHKK